MSKTIHTSISMPRELRNRLDDYNREKNLGDNLTDEIVRRIEWSFRAEERFERFLQSPAAAVERVLHDAFGSRKGEDIPAGAFNGRGEHAMDSAIYDVPPGTGKTIDPDPRAIKYIVVGRLPHGERTFLDTPEEAVKHAQHLIDRDSRKADPLLVAEVITVVERMAPVPPPVQVRAPRASDFKK